MCFVVRPKRLVCERWEAPEGPVGQIPPRELSQEGGRRSACTRSAFVHTVEHLTRRELTEPNERRDERRVALVRAMALPAIESMQCLQQKRLEGCLRGRLARRPKASDAVAPVDDASV